MNADPSPYELQLQNPLESLPGRVWDVVIIGTGPAGAICARLLAARGHAVLAVDKERFPRHKVCGDLLVPDALAILRAIGLYDRIAGMACHAGAIEVSSPSGHTFSVPGEYLALSRKRYDYELLRYAVEGGVRAAHANVVGVEPSSEGDLSLVRVSDRNLPLKARAVVLATGAVVDLARRAGLPGRTEPSAVAMRCYVRSPRMRTETIISYDRSIVPGYGWVIPLGPDPRGGFRYNVGCGTSFRNIRAGHHNLKRTLQIFMESFGPAREIMKGAEVLSPVAGASLRCGLESGEAIGKGTMLAIGETIGTTYPFTGEGIGKAMESGALAAEAIDEMLRGQSQSPVPRFRAAMEALRPRYEGYVIAERWLATPALNDFVSRRIARSPYLQDKVRRLMAETDNPRNLFSWKSLVRSYFA